MEKMTVTIIQTSKTVIKPFHRQRVHRTNLLANHPNNVFRRLGYVITTTIARMVVTRKLVPTKNVSHGCSLAATDDAFTILGDAVINIKSSS